MDELYRMEDGKLSDTSRTWTGQSWTLCEVHTSIPEPRSLAVPDSFLNSFAAEPATAASTTAGAIRSKLSHDIWKG